MGKQVGEDEGCQGHQYDDVEVGPDELVHFGLDFVRMHVIGDAKVSQDLVLHVAERSEGQQPAALIPEFGMADEQVALFFGQVMEYVGIQ